MSTARTARRRRQQAKLGPPGLEQVYGKKACPHYPKPMAAGVSARREAAFRERQARINKNKGRKK